MREAWDKNLGVEMGLIRKAIFVSGLVFAMPSPPATMQAGQVASVMPDSTSWAYIAAAADTVSDLKDFCVRKPQVCSTAQYIAGSMEGKAKYGAKLVYDWANESANGQNITAAPEITATVEPNITVVLKTKLHGTIAENSTLKMEDLVPVWRGTLTQAKG